jgi:hypothetical protein
MTRKYALDGTSLIRLPFDPEVSETENGQVN